MKKGTIVLTPFPFTDLKGQRVRPAVVVQEVINQEVMLSWLSFPPW